MLKKLSLTRMLAFAILVSFSSCADSTTESAAAASTEVTADGGQSTVQDDVSQKNVVQVAVGSADHSTLVTAVKAAELVDALSNAGPFTVFAPTNAAFDKLPEGTVEALLKADKKTELQDILQYHVSLGVFKPESFQDGQSIGQANGGNIKITLKDGKIYVNETAQIIASIPASNGIIHVIDGVLLPK